MKLTVCGLGFRVLGLLGGSWVVMNGVISKVTKNYNPFLNPKP